jgi:hypothetical protein
MIAKSISFIDSHGTEIGLGVIGGGGTAAALHLAGKTVSPLAVAGGAAAGVLLGVAVKHWKAEEIHTAKAEDLAARAAKLAEKVAQKAAKKTA